ncbi:hypothetical protein [Azospirillum sp. B4]|uniref:variant leucine-rich repeat-containing protein n=1 Tax=Azospirillum sp. B4 TaxID=95605 RepID=UPI00131F2487|nr:hypothetical protein [Azospirillum sp. B4]
MARLAFDPHPLVRTAAARDPTTPAAIQEQPEADEMMPVAQPNSESPPGPLTGLQQLARTYGQDSFWEPPPSAAEKWLWKEVGIAKDTSTPLEELERLAGDAKDDVRWAVAQNQSASRELLKRLANDEDRDVREAVADNPSTPPEVLEGLIRHPEETVWLAAVKNPSILLESLPNEFSHWLSLLPKYLGPDDHDQDDE